jgi:hypothetical protein
MYPDVVYVSCYSLSPIYNSFDFFTKLDRLDLFNFFKDEKFKDILKIYYMLNIIIIKSNNNYEIF